MVAGVQERTNVLSDEELEQRFEVTLACVLHVRLCGRMCVDMRACMMCSDMRDVSVSVSDGVSDFQVAATKAKLGEEERSLTTSIDVLREMEVISRFAAVGVAQQSAGRDRCWRTPRVFPTPHCEELDGSQFWLGEEGIVVTGAMMLAVF
jgi:hypothetical protein